VDRKIGIYGGTFDPIHYAHLILAREAAEQMQLDEIVFVPAAISPHKLGETPAPPILRVEMLRAALTGEPLFTIDECELHRPAPSYTIDTVEEMKRRDPEIEIFFLVGSDNLARLGTWHRSADLRKLVQFVVLRRGPIPPELEFPIVGRQIDISATEIRNRVATDRSIRYLVPPAVEEIIRRHQLYQEPQKSLQKN